MIEPELAFADLYDNMDCAEAYVKFCLKYVLQNNGDDLAFLDDRMRKGLIAYLTEISESDFVRCSYTEAITILGDAEKQGANFEQKVTWGMDLGSEHERFMAEKVFKKPVFLYNYPKEIKAFYMKVTDGSQTIIICRWQVREGYGHADPADRRVNWRVSERGGL
jgi:asparaginyl-tRNA synthetase